MKFKIYFQYKDGTEDNLIVERDTIEEIRETVEIELNRRGVEYTGSEEL